MRSIKRVLVSALLLLGVAPYALSAPAPLPAAPKNAVFTITYVDVAEAAIPETTGALKHYSDAVSTSAMVELYQEIDRADHFVIVAQWPDQAAYAAQKSGAAATELAGALKTFESAPPDTHVFQVYSSGPLHLPMGGRARVYGIGEFEVAAGKTGGVAAMLTPLADMSRGDPGEMRFDILQEQAPRQNRFVILDAWSSPQDFEKHRVAPHMVKFRDGLAPLMTATFEDRIYGKFN